VRAFIKSSKVKNTTAKAAKMVVATCVLCGAIIGSSASPASAATQAPVRADYIEYAAMWEWTPPGQAFLAALGSLPADRGDSEPPHPAELDQTFPGSASAYSGTASATGVINGLPQLSTLPYGGGAVPTSPVTMAVRQNWAPLSMGHDHTLVLGLPEHAQLRQLPPMIHMPAGYQAVPANSRSDRRDRGHHRRRLLCTLQETGPTRCPMVIPSSSATARRHHAVIYHLH
jgi:hypothetical protein